jgi:hypothetical protein
MCSGIVRLHLKEFANRLARRVHFVERHLQRRLQIQERRPAGILGQYLLGMLQGGTRLIAFDHAVDFFDVADQIGATKFELFAAATGTRSVGVDRHWNVSGSYRAG